MSLSDIILFPHLPKEIFTEYRNKNRISVRNLESVDKVVGKLFTLSSSGDKFAQLILFDFFINVNHFNVQKDNITGKRIEQRLSQLFALSTGDEIWRSSPKIEKLMSQEHILLFDELVLALVASNFRQKGDLIFYDPVNDSMYKLSIKSLVPENKEINFGAFEFKSTIVGIEGLEGLLAVQERNRTIDLVVEGATISGIGLGSSPQLKQLFLYIESQGKLSEYLYRFEILLRAVFKDDFLVYIKDNYKFTLFTIPNETFIKITMNRVSNGFKNTRVEGNALRMASLGEFKNSASTIFEYPRGKAIPDFAKIEELFLDSDRNKARLFRRFIEST